MLHNRVVVMHTRIKKTKFDGYSCVYDVTLKQYRYLFRIAAEMRPKSLQNILHIFRSEHCLKYVTLKQYRYLFQIAAEMRPKSLRNILHIFRSKHCLKYCVVTFSLCAIKQPVIIVTLFEKIYWQLSSTS